MEIRPVPHRAPVGAGVWLAVVCAVAAPLVLLVLLPGVLGLQRYVVTGRSTDGPVDRGSLILTRRVPVTDLVAGDVISFVPPAPYAGEGLVTRRVARVEPGVVETVADGTHGIDPWRLPTNGPSVSRMVFHVPWIGYPFLHAADRGLWVMLAAVPLAAIGVAFGADQQRRRQHARESIVLSVAGGPRDPRRPGALAAGVRSPENE